MENKDAHANAESYSELKQHHTVESQLIFWNIYGFPFIQKVIKTQS